MIVEHVLIFFIYLFFIFIFLGVGGSFSSIIETTRFIPNTVVYYVTLNLVSYYTNIA